MGLVSLSASPTSALLEGVQTGMLTEINAAVPIAGGVMAVIAGIFIAVKIFKRVTGART